jgi:hypothetical protein
MCKSSWKIKTEGYWLGLRIAINKIKNLWGNNKDQVERKERKISAKTSMTFPKRFARCF